MNQTARMLRQHQTEAENRIWRHLRNRGLAGYKFRRQYPIGPYIADFACLEIGLVVEIDGGQHAERADDDAKRTKFIEAQGYKVLRFWNHDVLRETEAVLNVILNVLNGLSSPAREVSLVK